MQEFAVKVQNSRGLAQEEVQSWDEEKKSSYFSSFLDHPVMRNITGSEGEPTAKINALLDLTASEVQDITKFVMVASGDFDLSKKLAEIKGEQADVSGLEASIRNIQVTLTSLANLKPRNTSDHDHSHGHSHDHQPQNSWDPLKPDISKGKVDKMER